MVEFLFNFFIDPSTGDIVHDSFHHLFPIFQFSCYCTFLPISFLVLNQWVVKLQNVWIFLPSAVVSLNFFSRLQENLFSVCSPFLWWFFFFLSEVMMQSGLAMVPIFIQPFLILPLCTHQSFCFPLSAIFLPAAEWRPWWVWRWVQRTEQSVARGTWPINCFCKTVVFKCSHTHSFTHHLWLLSCNKGTSE